MVRSTFSKPDNHPSLESPLGRNADCTISVVGLSAEADDRPAHRSLVRATDDIYDELLAKGYKFTFKEQKKVLGIRLYKMLGVQPLGGGLFRAK
jgi:hypothetical protein